MALPGPNDFDGALSRPMPGATIANKYVVERVIGEGGMGYVVSAHHLQLKRRFALKFLLPAAAQSAETTARFLQEAQAAARITSENVARVVDVGTLDTGLPFMVMEYLEGSDLGAVLDDRRAPLPVGDAVDYVLQAMEALGEAHLAGIIHRDIKPSNLFLTRRADGSALIKVLDFGLSKDVSATRREHALTRSSTGAMGSPLYMAPEQVRSAKAASFASDIWSLGVVLYELVTDDAPFMGDNVGELLASILADAPKPMARPGRALPAGLEEVVMRCLRKTATERWPDIAALSVALAPFATPRGRSSVERIAAMFAAAGRRDVGPEMAVAPAAVSGHSFDPQTADRNVGVRTLDGAVQASLARGASRTALLLIGSLMGALIVTFVVVSVLVGSGRRPETRPASEPEMAPLPAESVASPSPPEVTPVPEDPSAPASAHDVVPSSSASSSSASSSSSSTAAPTAAPTARPPRPKPAAPPPKKSAPTIDDLVKQGRR